MWRFDPATNTTSPAAEGFVMPNGVAFSPDFTTAYVTDTGAVGCSCCCWAAHRTVPGGLPCPSSAMRMASRCRGGSLEAGGHSLASSLPAACPQVDGTGAPASFAAAAPAIYAFDVATDAAGLPQLRGRRLFAVSPSGIPDGIKLDNRGNVYVGVPGGVDVFSPSGQALGSIAVGPTANLAFAGSELVMLQEDRVTALPLRIRGAQLPLQAAS